MSDAEVLVAVADGDPTDLRPVAGASRGSVVRAIARIEGVRLLRHPLVLLAAAAVVIINIPGPGPDPGWEIRWGIEGATLFPFAVGAMVVVHWAMSRDWRSATAELAASLPTGMRQRVPAHALSLVWVLVPLCLAWSGYVAVWFGGELSTTIFGYLWEPSIVELAQGPVAVAVYLLLALATGVWWRHAVGGVVVAVLFAFSPLVWLIPLVIDLGKVAPWGSPGPVTLPLSYTIWHYVFLAGTAALLMAAALLRHGSRRTWATVMVISAAAMAFAVVLRGPELIG